MGKDRLCLHHTAGNYHPNMQDLAHYHRIIDNLGIRHDGRLPLLSNRAPLSGDYIAHCGGGNSNTIGLAVAAMLGFVNKYNVGPCPITAMQIEALFAEAAKICRQLTIPIVPERVYTHYEFGQRNPTTTSHGKIDLTFLPSYPDIKRDESGDFIRDKVRWYHDKVFKP